MRIGIIVGSLSSTSINRKVAKALISMAPDGVDMYEIDWSDLPLYTPDYDADYPVAGREWKAAIEEADGIIIVSPEYSRSIPGALKNALDWAARPWGTGSFNGKPVAIAGASGGAIGTAAMQQHLRAILGHFNAITMGQPETFLQIKPSSFGEHGEIADESLAGILEGFLLAAVSHTERFAPVKA